MGLSVKPVRSSHAWLTYAGLSDPEGVGTLTLPETARTADIGPKSYRQRPQVPYKLRHQKKFHAAEAERLRRVVPEAGVKRPAVCGGGRRRLLSHPTAGRSHHVHLWSATSCP